MDCESHCCVKAVQAFLKYKGWRRWFTCQARRERFEAGDLFWAKILNLNKHNSNWGRHTMSGGDEDVCFICFESSHPPIQSCCACRGAAGLAHDECRVKAADTLVRRTGQDMWWWTCQTCEQEFTGAMGTGLARAWCSRVCERAEENRERLEAMNNLAVSLNSEGKHAEAAEIQRAVLAVRTRVLGPEHPDKLTTANNLAICLSRQGKHAEAEEMLHEVLAARKRVLGTEHPSTLVTGNKLGNCLSGQGKHAEADELLREVLAARKRVLGREHPHTLNTASNLAISLHSQGKHVEAEKIQREVSACRKRTAEGQGACDNPCKRRK